MAEFGGNVRADAQDPTGDHRCAPAPGEHHEHEAQPAPRPARPAQLPDRRCPRAPRTQSSAVVRPAIIVVVEALLGVVAIGYALSYEFEPVVMTALALWYALEPSGDAPTDPPSRLPH